MPKKERQIKVYSQHGYYGADQRPAIFLQGKWVQELGFNIGDHCIIICDDNKITIQKADQ